MILARKRSEAPSMTLEGPLGPNDRLEQAPGMQVAAPGALCVAADGRLLLSSGVRVLALDKWGAVPVELATFDLPVTALAASPGGHVAIGLAGGGMAVLDGAGKALDGWAAPDDLAAVTDCLFLSEDEILLVDSGYASDRELPPLATWEDAARGSVVVARRGGGARRVVDGLHCPSGVCLSAAGDAMVSLFERAKVIDLAGRDLQTGYPGYLGRLCRIPTGFALACYSRRDPLIEFLKTEPAFIAEMKAKLDPRDWISPRTSPEFSHRLPIEAGATRLFGEVKPWAPSFSYGLVILTDERLTPVSALHSRANGRRHAISDVAEWNGRLVAVSRASGEILDLDVGGEP